MSKIIIICTFLICMMIQWHGHYMKGEVSFWLDTVPMFGLIIYLFFIEDNQ